MQQFWFRIVSQSEVRIRIYSGKELFSMRSLPIYIASPYSRAERAEEIAQAIAKESRPGQPVYVLSRWHRQSASTNFPEVRIQNMLDLEASHVVVALTDPILGRETYVEIGFHLARGKHVVWLPSREKEQPCLSLMTSDLVFKMENEEELLTHIRMRAANMSTHLAWTSKD
jgi:nucleoside 2-deoxyribosyltransferase